MIKKVLVVGGAGYIGGTVTELLMEQNIPFSVYDNILYEHQYFKPVDFIFGDIRDTEKLASLLPHYSHVIWLAAIVGDPACKLKPELTIAINQQTVKWLSEHFDGRIIFLSTCSVYGQNDHLLDETSDTHPLSVYAETKLNAEQYLIDKNCLILRLGTVFGVADHFARLRMDLAVNYMTANALKKGALSVYGGDQWRPMIHVKDVGKAIVHNLDRDIKGVYNLASFNTQIKDLGEQIAKITGCDIEYVDYKFQDNRNYRVNFDKAVNDEVCDPETALKIQDGVKEISDIITSGRIKYSENDIYFNERALSKLIENNEIS